MKNKTYLLSLFIFLSFGLFCTNTSFATNWDWGTNITIHDGSEGDGGDGWYTGENKGKEDQEVEKNNQIGQVWDLEGFFLNGTKLTMVGGYDFQNGHDGTTSGDIFIDVDGSYAQTTDLLTGNYGYEYVLDMDWANLVYTVYSLKENAALENVSFSQNYFSNPWQYSGGTTFDSTALYQTGISGSDSGFLGDTHNAVQVDLSFLSADELANFTAHFTMSCGNDNLMGASPVPEPATMVLFGIGLLGLSAIGRKRS